MKQEHAGASAGARAPETDAYILGTDAEELERLAYQHNAWQRPLFALLERGALARGARVLDLGCGPGYTSLELGGIVGPGGHVLARDLSAAFIAHLAGELRRRGWTHVEPSLGPVEELDLAPGSLDAAYARWLFCWLPDPGAVLARVARALKPGGVLLLQEYVDWASMRLLPPHPAHERVVAACMQSWAEGGGTIDIAALLPDLAPASGLVLESFEPIPRVGGPGSMVWGWLGGFYESYLPRLVRRGTLSADELRAFEGEWQRRTDAGEGLLYAPTVANVVLRRP